MIVLLGCRELGQSQNGRRSWWAIGFLIAGILCGVSMISNMQLKADNRGLRKELALKEQVVSNLAYSLKTVNRHQGSHFRVLESEWRAGRSAVHRAAPVKVWTFDGSRW